MQQFAASIFDQGSSAALRPHPTCMAGEASILHAQSYTADQAAIRHFAAYGGTLCTLVHIDGSYSRRRGAQLAIAPDGRTAGDLADHCLERELVHRANLLESQKTPELLVYGKGSPFIDFQLPCGSTIHLLLDPTPSQEAARRIVSRLDARRSASLDLPQVKGSQYSQRHYLPAMRILVFGEGPEAEAMQRLAGAYGAEASVRPAATSQVQLTRQKCDSWTAIVCLSHDHEWERSTLPWALGSDAFYVGAIGGAKACASRIAMLQQANVSPRDIARMNAPIGLFPSARHPAALALSALAEIAAAYEELADE